MGLTKQVLRRPVTTVLVVLCLIVFGLSSVFSSKLELTPEMEMPMLVVNAVYPGASPEDVEELVTKPIEDEIGTLTGVDTITSMSAENFGLVLLQYEYGKDMDKAYDDLKKKLDGLANEFPEDVQTPTIIEMDINDTPAITLAVNNEQADNLYNYVDSRIVPEFEKLSSVASVDVSGCEPAGRRKGLCEGGADPGKAGPVPSEHEHHRPVRGLRRFFHAHRQHHCGKQKAFCDLGH